MPPTSPVDVNDPANAKLVESCRVIGTRIAEALEGANTGFVLVLFGLDNDFTTYLANVERPDAIKAIRELADRLEGD